MPSYFPENNTPLVLDTETKSLQKINGAVEASLGQRGAIVSDGTVTGNFVAIQIVSDGTTFDAISATDSDFGVLVAQSLPTGFVFYGPFTEVVSSGGIYIAYKA